MCFTPLIRVSGSCTIHTVQYIQLSSVLIRFILVASAFLVQALYFISKVLTWPCVCVCGEGEGMRVERKQVYDQCV